ncbi:hypothetical protein GCM10027567_09140 [Spongiibacter taiwanensis]
MYDRSEGLPKYRYTRERAVFSMLITYLSFLDARVREHEDTKATLDSSAPSLERQSG